MLVNERKMQSKFIDLALSMGKRNGDWILTEHRESV